MMSPFDFRSDVMPAGVRLFSFWFFRHSFAAICDDVIIKPI
jgi:hypothetical protein